MLAQGFCCSTTKNSLSQPDISSRTLRNNGVADRLGLPFSDWNILRYAWLPLPTHFSHNQTWLRSQTHCSRTSHDEKL